MEQLAVNSTASFDKLLTRTYRFACGKTITTKLDLEYIVGYTPKMTYEVFCRRMMSRPNNNR